jgi:hypothetical protein
MFQSLPPFVAAMSRPATHVAINGVNTSVSVYAASRILCINDFAAIKTSVLCLYRFSKFLL